MNQPDLKKEQVRLVKELDRWLRGGVNRKGRVDGHGSLGALTDIKKAYHADVGTFILGSCFIEAMAGFRYGVTKKNMEKGSGRRFKAFVRKYLPKYNADDMYHSLRCGLVHNYVEHHGKYFLDSTDNSLSLHLKSDNGRVRINRKRFVDDLEKTYKKLRKDILTDTKIFANATKRLKSLGLMRIKEN